MFSSVFKEIWNRSSGRVGVGQFISSKVIGMWSDGLVIAEYGLESGKVVQYHELIIIFQTYSR